MGRDGALYTRDCMIWPWWYGRRHLKYPCKKLHSGLRILAIWKIIYIVIYSFCSVISYSLLSAQGQSVPCNSLFKHYVEKKGFFSIKHLILILSLSLIVTTHGKLILLSLKVTLTSFQSISRVSQIKF